MMKRCPLRASRRALSLLLLLSLFASLCGCAPSVPAGTAPTPIDIPLIESAAPSAEPAPTAAPAAPSSSAAPAPSAAPAAPKKEFSLADIPAYSGSAFCVVNDNVPFFEEDELDGEAFEEYHPLDALGRCGTAFSRIGEELMPTESRGSISSVKPTGWKSVQYDFVDGHSLYNRCHLIGWQLTAENANRENLITGTRYLNTVGMLPFENMTADYIKETGNHVLYRVTPVFEGDNLVASGVLMEGESVEDRGDGVLFCVYCYNVQPGVVIDYATGENAEAPSETGGEKETYILNTGTRKFHRPDCDSVKTMKEEKKQEYYGTRELLIEQGYAPCGNCRP